MAEAQNQGNSDETMEKTEKHLQESELFKQKV